MTNKNYYASPETATQEAAKKIAEIIKTHQMRLHSSRGMSRVWNRNLEIYYKNALCDVLDFVGHQGELVSMSIPQARSLTRQTVSIVCKQKLNFKALSRATDYSSMASGRIAEALANQLVRKQKLDSKKDLLAEQAYVLGQAFWHVEWDSEGGESVAPKAPTMNQPMPQNGAQMQQPGIAPPIAPQMPQEGQLDPSQALNGPIEAPSATPMLPDMKSGEVKITVIMPQYVYYDWNVSHWDELNWVAVGERVNRFDMMAQHPELEAEIRMLPKFDRNAQSFVINTRFGPQEDDSNDLILIYKYYHRPTPAVPHGRMMILGSETCVFYDGTNPYESLPVIAVIPEKMPDYLLGYPQFSNLAPAQEMLDHNFSVVASNQTTFGVQTILNPRGSNIDITQINGMQWVDFTPQSIDGGGKPEPLQLTRTAPELINMLDVYKGNMAELANISGALRGTPPAGITAGNALATLTANSIEFLTAFSQSVYNSIEELMTLSVKFYRMFGAENQIVSVADGKTMYAQEFKNSDLTTFERVTLDITNPTMATYGGRQNDVEQLLAQGLIPDIGTYFRVKEGAPVSTTYEMVLDESNLIQKENDDLMDGIECPVLFTDNHKMHIMHHQALLNNPEIRRNGQAIQIILGHIEQHKQLEMQAMQGQMPPQGAPGQPPPPGAPQGQPTEGPPPGGPDQAAASPAQPAKPQVSF